MIVAFLECLDAIRVEDYVESSRRDLLRSFPKVFFGLVDDMVAPKCARRFDFVGAPYDAGDLAARAFRKLDETASDTSGSTVNEDSVAFSRVGEIPQCKVSGEKHRGKSRSLLESEVVGNREDLVPWNRELRRIAIEECHCEDACPHGEIADVRANAPNDARNLEARSNGPAHELLGGSVEAHAHDDVRVVHPDGTDVDHDVVGPHHDRAPRLDLELVVGTRGVNDDLPNVARPFRSFRAVGRSCAVCLLNSVHVPFPLHIDVLIGIESFARGAPRLIGKGRRGGSLLGVEEASECDQRVGVHAARHVLSLPVGRDELGFDELFEMVRDRGCADVEPVKDVVQEAHVAFFESPLSTFPNFGEQAVAVRVPERFEHPHELLGASVHRFDDVIAIELSAVKDGTHNPSCRPPRRS